MSSIGVNPGIRYRKTIAVDIDEVLCPFLRPMATWSKRCIKPGKIPYVYRDIFDISEKESRNMVYSFYESTAFDNLSPIKHAQKGIQLLNSNGYKIYIVTGRQNRVREKTEKWLDTFFPGGFEDLIMTNSYTINEVTKDDVCKSIGANMIIDDNLDICKQCDASHIRALNFIGDPIYPWCEENSFAIQSWNEISDYI